MKKKGGGGNLKRSEIVQARFSPKLRFAADLLSRQTRRTVSSLLESALEEYIKNVSLKIIPPNQLFIEPHNLLDNPYITVSAEDAVKQLWDPNEATRFVLMALAMPEVLTPDEETLWEFVRRVPYFWIHYEVDVVDRQGTFLRKDWQQLTTRDGLIVENLTLYWPRFQTKDDDNFVNASGEIPCFKGQCIERPAHCPATITQYFPNLLREAHQATKTPENRKISIWYTEIREMLKEIDEVVETPDGQKTVKRLVFPTAEEQATIVEKVYKERYGDAEIS